MMQGRSDGYETRLIPCLVVLAYTVNSRYNDLNGDRFLMLYGYISHPAHSTNLV